MHRVISYSQRKANAKHCCNVRRMCSHDNAIKDIRPTTSITYDVAYSTIKPRIATTALSLQTTFIISQNVTQSPSPFSTQTYDAIQGKTASRWGLRTAAFIAFAVCCICVSRTRSLRDMSFTQSRIVDVLLL